MNPNPNTKNEILKQIKALGFVYQQDGKWFKTDYVGDQDVDEKINKFVESIASKLQEVETKTKNLCRKIYVDNVDWSERGIADNEASDNFDNAYDELTQLKGEHI